MSKFTVSIEYKKVEMHTADFTDKNQANAHARKLMKDNNLIRHAGHIVNYSEFLELFKNY